ncbi:MAG: DUF327 family protein [Spirochaetota bacterium]|nr:DUF327 family protein [Spirochaetota bacterium]
MIKITPTTTKGDNTRIKSKKKTKSVNKEAATFETTLEETISFKIHGSIQELLEDLSVQEKRFLDSQSRYDLEKYKAMVQKILKTILDDGFKTDVLKRLRNDKADFLIIKEINQKMFEISSSITRETNKAFNLLKTIEEIKGLILDLLY